MGVYTQQTERKRPLVLIYGGWFTGLYIALLILVNFLAFGLGLDLGVLGGLLTVIIAAFGTGLVFVRREKTALEKPVQMRIAIFGIVAATVCSLLMSFIVLPKISGTGANPFTQFDGMFESFVWVFIMLLITGINFLLIHYFLGLGSANAKPASDKA